jgi:hypothetical protein
MKFLKAAGSSLWKGVVIGGVGKISDDKCSLRANHLHVDCNTPFLIAATSLDAPSGEEHFGITLITDRDSLDEFLEGPYPPHNRPRTLSLEKAIGRQIDAFLRAPKEIHLLRKTLKFVTEVTSLVPIEHGLVIAAEGFTLRIYADDEIPMGLQLTWEQE